MAERTAMNWTDDDGKQRKILKSGIERLRYVAKRSGTGRFQMPPGQPVWNTKDVRNFEDLGLWAVTWLEEGDVDRVGAWRIDGITDKAQRVLDEWKRLVEGGGAQRGPKRGQGANGA
ncbi:hypothetical protein ACLGIH_20525 [Streptomyces sp. HMX87]|uniref:hypothetical protein n=1 Tax=Streptomyces sp. HMX87 TaxID=3390849 RepID=UPI003A879529